jgi:hypothetical protein
VSTGLSVVMSHSLIWLITVGSLSFLDFRLSIVVYIGSFTLWAYYLGLYVTYGLLANNIQLDTAQIPE